MTIEFESFIDIFDAIPDEQSAVDHLRTMRWGANDENAHCPHCDSTRVNHFKDGKLHKCGDCRKKFTIKVGTIFEDSKVPLRKWFAAVWLLTSHKKGIASTTLAKDIKVTQKTAWFMLHRLRYATKTNSFNKPLDGEIEVDETYIGGKEKNKHKSKRKTGMQGGKGKAVVFGMIERSGDLKTKHVPDAKSKTLKPEIDANVKKGATVYSDEAKVYNALDAEYKHEAVNHSAGEYVRGDVHTNTLEGAWSLFKRQIIGIHHHLSEKHLHRYLDEMDWRYNRRDQREGQRLNNLLRNVGGKRLMYKDLIAS